MSGTIPSERAVDMAVSREGESVIVTLTGLSQRDQQIEYELELTGGSNSRHRGKTGLQANQKAVLSTMRMTVGADWCVTARITEQDGRSYEYSEGPCA